MFARSLTITADPASIDAGIDYVRDEAFPAIQALEGCVGTSLLVDRDSGRCIATSAWQTEAAMTASNGQVAPMRARAMELMGASGDPEVRTWEAAVMHRVPQEPHATAARATWLQVRDTSAIDHAIGVFRSGVLPALEQMDGFCSASLLIDRSTGMAVSTTSFTSMETLAASRASADTIRERASAEAGADVMDVEEFELAEAHLHLPELV